MANDYHIPVMLKECIEGLAIKPEGIYVDVTFGGGGHSREILKHLDGGHLYAFDQDQDVEQNQDLIEKSSFTFIAANFRYLKRYLKMMGVTAVDGVLADLGVSSHQIDVPDRGFTTRADGELDMRMDQKSKLTAKEILNSYDAKALQLLFSKYGEVRNAKTLAEAVVGYRQTKSLETTEEFKSILNRFAPRRKENRYMAQVFQAIRIEVNDEMRALEEMLEQSGELLKVGGRLVVMSYHSLEDRLVKNYILRGNTEGKEEKDFYGNLIRPLQPVNRKPIVASEIELEQNNRARSAKLRIAEKLDIQ